jgi:uncharacterized membrane protein (DUF106 family)
MSMVDAVLGACFNVLLLPFRGLPPLIGLVFLSLLAAIAMLLVFKRTSDQGAITAVKRKIHACLFEMRLFSDDLGALMRAQLRILRHNVTYVRLSLVPMLWLIVPFVLVLVQMQFHYAYQGLKPGDETVVKVNLAKGWEQTLGVAPEARPPVTLSVPDGLRVETPGVWIPSLDEVDWRVGVERPGSYTLTVRAGGRELVKRLDATNRVVRRSPVRLSAGFVNQLLFPAESPLPSDSPVRAIAVDYASAGIPILGLSVHWLVVFFVLSIALAFALRKRFDVAI